MVTLRMDASMACVEPIFRSYFDEGPLLDRQMDLDFLVPRYCFGCCGIWTPDKSRGSATLVKTQLGGIFSLL